MLKIDKNKKNIFLKCILTNNLGDDLLISSLCKRYSDVNFYTLDCSDKSTLNISNLNKIKFNFQIYRIIRKICHIFKFRCLVDTYYINKCDYNVVIGGSLFMEQKNNDDLFLWYKNLNNYCIIGSNIGPVYSPLFIKRLKDNIFKYADYVCLRDNKSYDYVNDLDNVSVASDIVFSLDVDKYKNVRLENKVVFSLIDVRRKSSQMSNPDFNGYINLVCDLIKMYYEKGFKIQLMSFCEDEGDEEIISYITKLLPDICIEKYFYNGNIDEALEVLASAKIIVGTRFHANILGLLFNKKILPLAYNDKTLNFLKDINFDGSIIDINNLSDFNIENLKFSTKNIDLINLKCSSNNHFKNLDLLLKRSSEND